jgi:hypothetical protein
MKKSIFVPFLLGIMLVGCSSVRVVRDYDRSTEFGHLNTYAWQHATQPETGNPRLDNDLIDARIRNAVNTSRFGGVGYNTGISDYEEGVLIIDIIDTRDDKVIWRGTGTRVVYEGSDPEKVSKIVNKSVSKILAKFPPGK